MSGRVIADVTVTTPLVDDRWTFTAVEDPDNAAGRYYVQTWRQDDDEPAEALVYVVAFPTPAATADYIGRRAREILLEELTQGADK